MPHIIIEYSNNFEDVNMKDMVHDCHHVLDGLHNVTTDRVKTRAIKLKNFSVGTYGDQGHMVHVNLKLMTGRSPEARQEMAKILYDVVKKHITADKYPNAAVTVEVTELDRATYIA